MKNRSLLWMASSMLALACASSDEPATDSSHPATESDAPAMKPGEAGSAAAPDAPAFKPFGANADLVAWSTEQFALEAGQERYLCFAKTLDEDAVVNGYSNRGQKFVHHLIFARATAPEAEGFAECDTAFRQSWETLFISGAGDNALELPMDAGHELKKGTQLIVQMHLLNLAETRVESSVTIDMRRSSVESPRPVSSFIFGTAAVELPASATGATVVGTCTMRQELELIAGFPHMHLLGRSMRFETGPSMNELKEVFKRDPFDFDNQHVDNVVLKLARGDVTRVTCKFDNPHDKKIGYGESTLDEMCYFVGFAVGLPRQSACLEVLPPNIFR